MCHKRAPIIRFTRIASMWAAVKPLIRSMQTSRTQRNFCFAIKSSLPLAVNAHKWSLIDDHLSSMYCILKLRKAGPLDTIMEWNQSIILLCDLTSISSTILIRTLWWTSLQKVWLTIESFAWSLLLKQAKTCNATSSGSLSSIFSHSKWHYAVGLVNS